MMPRSLKISLIFILLFTLFFPFIIVLDKGMETKLIDVLMGFLVGLFFSHIIVSFFYAISVMKNESKNMGILYDFENYFQSAKYPWYMKVMSISLSFFIEIWVMFLPLLFLSLFLGILAVFSIAIYQDLNILDNVVQISYPSLLLLIVFLIIPIIALVVLGYLISLFFVNDYAPLFTYFIVLSLYFLFSTIFHSQSLSLELNHSSFSNTASLRFFLAIVFSGISYSLYRSGKLELKIQEMAHTLNIPKPETINSAENHNLVPSYENLTSNSNYLVIKSPLTGTFHRSDKLENPPIISVGDEIHPGKVICVIEIWGDFHEIESEIKGKIVKVLVADATPVEYEQPLFLVDPIA